MEGSGGGQWFMSYRDRDWSHKETGDPAELEVTEGRIEDTEEERCGH